MLGGGGFQGFLFEKILVELGLAIAPFPHLPGRTHGGPSPCQEPKGHPFKGFLGGMGA